MKKAMMMMAMVGVLGASVAGAQTLQTENGKLQIVACYGTNEGVQCDALYTLVKKQNLDVTLYDNHIEATLPSGDQVNPRLSSGGKTDYGSYTEFNAQYNIPVKVTMIFNIPNTTTSIRTLTLDDNRVENVPVRPVGAPAPAPVTNAAPAPAQAINISGNWNATLSGCRQSAPGVVVCTATLRK